RSCSTDTNSLPATNSRWPTPICSRCSTGPISTRSISQNGRTSRHTWLESVQGRRCRKPCGRKVCWDSTQHPARLHEVRSGHRPDALGVPPNAARPRRRGDRVKGPIYFRGKRRKTRHGTKRTFSFWRSNLANAGLRLDALLRCLFLPNQEVFQNVFPVCGGQ